MELTVLLTRGETSFSHAYANIYPHAWLGAFRDWLQRQYLKEEFLAYVQKHALPLQSSAHKQLPPGGRSE
jgi:hypothetical protein